jgi:two-component system, sensor histidine kinase
MTDQARKTGFKPQITFHARVAGVALITTVVVLVAACFTFMLQQWAVAREQNHQAHRALSEITARTVSEALVAGDPDKARDSIATLVTDQSVVSAVLSDPAGRPIARFVRNSPAADVTLDTLHTPVVSQGAKVGELSMTFETPALTSSPRSPVRCSSGGLAWLCSSPGASPLE